MGILRERGTYGGHVLRDERELERIVEHVSELDGLFARERTGNGRAGAADGFAHGRGGLELAVEDDGELADGARVAFGNLSGEVTELLGPFVGELHVHVEGDAVVRTTGGGLDDLTSGVGGLADVVTVDGNLAGAAIDIAEREYLVGRDGGILTQHRVHRHRTKRTLAVGLSGTFGAVHLTELELRGLLQRVDDIRVISGVFTRELDLERESAYGADYWLGDAELIDALFHDLDGLIDHVSGGNVGLIAHALLAGLGTGRVDLQREGHPAL